MATDSETAVEMAVVNITAVEEMNGSGSSFSSVAVAEITASAVKSPDRESGNAPLTSL